MIIVTIGKSIITRVACKLSNLYWRTILNYCQLCNNIWGGRISFPMRRTLVLEVFVIIRTAKSKPAKTPDLGISTTRCFTWRIGSALMYPCLGMQVSSSIYMSPLQNNVAFHCGNKMLYRYWGKPHCCLVCKYDDFMSLC